MKSATAILKFLNTDNYHKVFMPELKEFKAACTPEEWSDFGRQACEALGEVHEK